MANNLRTIKKDIDFLADEVIADCCTFMYLHPDRGEDEINAIINQAVDLRNDLFDRVNHPEDNPKKPYYRAIKKDLVEGVDALYDKISQLAKK